MLGADNLAELPRVHVLSPLVEEYRLALLLVRIGGLAKLQAHLHREDALDEGLAAQVAVHGRLPPIASEHRCGRAAAWSAAAWSAAATVGGRVRGVLLGRAVQCLEERFVRLGGVVHLAELERGVESIEGLLEGARGRLRLRW